MDMWVPSRAPAHCKLPSAEEAVHNFLDTTSLWYSDISMATCGDRLTDFMTDRTH